MHRIDAALQPWLAGLAACEVALPAMGGAAAIQAAQERRLHSIVRSAATRSPLYRRLLVDLPDSFALQDLPVVHKRELMDAFDQWVTDPELHLADVRRMMADCSRIAEPYLGRYTVWQSSGSSGEPAVFIQDDAAMATYDALEVQRRPAPLHRLFDPWYFGERMAFVGATNGHFASVVATRRARRVNPALSVGMREFSFLEPLDDLLAGVVGLQPTILCTYPSMAVLLAGERTAGRLPVHLREVWTGGETLTPSMRDLVQQAFGCPVVDSYGASEFLPIAASCRHGQLHVNADWVILEPVDAQGRPVPDDVLSSTTLVTNLANHVQPLIRYDLGDRIRRLSRPCLCGSCLPVIEVIGREDDVLRLVDGQHKTNILPLAVCTVLEEEAGLFDFLLEQTGPLSLRLSTPRDDEGASSVLACGRHALQRFLARQGAGRARIAVRAGEPSRRGRSGKAMRVVASTSSRAPTAPQAQSATGPERPHRAVEPAQPGDARAT